MKILIHDHEIRMRVMRQEESPAQRRRAIRAHEVGHQARLRKNAAPLLNGKISGIQLRQAVALVSKFIQTDIQISAINVAYRADQRISPSKFRDTLKRIQAESNKVHYAFLTGFYSPQKRSPPVFK